MAAPLRLAEVTTTRVGGPVGSVVVAESEADLIAAVRDHADDVLVLGAGSNILAGDEGFAGTVVLVASRGMSGTDEQCAGAWLTVEAGHPWDEVVAEAIENEWSGIEALSGIPGLTGATPIQNVGAYGQEVAQTIARVRAFDRERGDVVTLANADCGFAYRSSLFKRNPGRYVVLSVDFQLSRGSLSSPVQYAELARTLGVEVGDRVPSTRVREAVLDLRRRKGMVLDEDDHDTWSTGSFFTNPVLDAASAGRLPADAPRWAQPDGTVKTSAAWLVEQAGFAKGWSVRGSARASLSGKHTLALTNRGGASAADLLELARAVRDGVQAAFGVRLEPEAVLVGCSLDERATD